MRGARLLVAAVLAAIGVGVGIEGGLGAGSGQRTPSLQASPAAVVSRRPLVEATALASTWVFSGIAAVGGRPVLTGARHFSRYGAASQCIDATVDPATLRLAPAQPYRCGADPTAGGKAFAEVIQPPRTFRAEIRVGRTDPETGRTSLGPVVMTFGRYSTSRPVITTGYGSLWIYDVDTPGGAELLRVSEATGRTENRILLPKGTIRPVMAADRAGLWVGISPGGASGASQSPIWFVPTGSDRARVVWRGGNSVFWAVSDGGHVWFDVFDAGLGLARGQRLVRFDGARSQPSLDVAIHGPAAAWVTNETVLDGRASDLWTLSWPPAADESLACGSAAVVRIDSRTGRATVAGRLPAPSVDQYDGCNGLDPGEAVVAGSHLFVLEGRSSLGTSNGYARLYAISLPSR